MTQFQGQDSTIVALSLCKAITPARSFATASRPLLGAENGEPLERIDSVETEHVLSQTEIHGTANDSARLTVEDLRRCGMEPNFKLEIAGRFVYLPGQLFQVEDGRTAIVAYVEDEKDENPQEKIFTVRSFYRSNSQGGSWRYVPAASLYGGHVYWYSKGHDENSLNVPSQLLEAFQKIRVIGGIKYDLATEDRLRLAVGSARLCMEFGGGEGFTYSQVVSYQGRVLNEGTWTQRQDGQAKTPPHLVGVSKAGESPNLIECKKKFAIESPINSDGIPDQVIIRSSVYDIDPTVLNLQPVEVEAGRWVVPRPDGGSLVFSSQGQKRIITEIVDNEGSIHVVDPFAPRRGSYEMRDDESDSRWEESAGERYYFSALGHIERIESRKTEQVCEFVHGLMDARSFESKEVVDEIGSKLHYLFLTDKFDRSMVGSIWEDGHINQIGIYSRWARSPSLTTPLYEYPQMALGWGDHGDRSDRYIGMWANYLSQVPLIREFHELHIKTELPALIPPDQVGRLHDDDWFELGDEGVDGVVWDDDAIDNDDVLLEERAAIVSDQAELMIGDAYATVRIDKSGDLLLLVPDESHVLRYSLEYVRKNKVIDIGAGGPRSILNHPSISSRHFRLSFEEESNSDGTRTLTFAITSLAGYCEVDGELLEIPSYPLVKATLR